jgi:hypothetical protein
MANPSLDEQLSEAVREYPALYENNSLLRAVTCQWIKKRKVIIKRSSAEIGSPPILVCYFVIFSRTHPRR